jgi:CPA2 family monovalent cation:H+ antiporter-2
MDGLPTATTISPTLAGHVILGGYGRVGQGIGNVLEQEGIPFIAVDLDAPRVRTAHQGGEPVVYGDSGQREILEALGIARARLLVLAHGENTASLRTLRLVRSQWPEVPVMVRTRDEDSVDEFYDAGASAVFPETLEAGLMMASQVLKEMRVPLGRILSVIEEQRTGKYAELRRIFVGEIPGEEQDAAADADRLRPVRLAPGSAAIGRALGELELKEVVVTALVRSGRRELEPGRERRLEAGDTLVLFGAPDPLRAAERQLTG